MRALRLLTLLFVVSGLFSCKQKADDTDYLNSIPNPKTLGETYVSNPDGLLKEETVSLLNTKLIPLDQSGTAHIDVVMVKTIGENVPKDFAHQLFNKWKIGDPKKNNGLLILLVEDQKRMEFETGYGLEGILPDLTCYRIQQQYMVPRAKEGNFDQAVLDGVDAVISKLNESTDTDNQTNNVDVNEKRTDNGAASTATDTALTTNRVVDQSISKPTTPEAIVPSEPYIEYLDNKNASNEPSITNPRTFDSWFNVAIVGIYLILCAKIARDLGGRSFKYVLLNPLFYFLAVIGIAGIIALDRYVPVSWMTVRQALFLYGLLFLFIQFNVLMWTALSESKLNAFSNHQKYVKVQDFHHPISWARFIFPLLIPYWRMFLNRQRKLRDSPIACEKCQNPMIRLDENQDNQYISKGQRVEEEIESTDYDVWVCTDCKTRLVLDYQNLYSKAEACPACKFKTLVFKENRVVQRATTSSSGSGYRLSICKNCNHNKKVDYTIAKISTSSSSSSGGSSSSSSRSSSSGGSSGGGGAGSSW